MVFYLSQMTLLWGYIPYKALEDLNGDRERCGGRGRAEARPRLRPAGQGSRRVTTLPERAFFAIRAPWQRMDEGPHSLLLPAARAGRPGRANRPASMPPVSAA